jgi:hypothetical protein
MVEADWFVVASLNNVLTCAVLLEAYYDDMVPIEIFNPHS